SLPPTPRPGARLPPTPRIGWSSWCARPGSASIDTASAAMTTPNIDLGRFGVFTWDPGSSFLGLGLAVTPEQAQEIEQLGYGTLWVTGSPAAELSFAEPLLESTTALKVATGIVNIWTADAKTVAASFHRVNAAHPGRFVLGIGAGHPEHTEQYRKPYDALVDYLDELDEYRVPATQRVLAALGPASAEAGRWTHRRGAPVQHHTRTDRAGPRNHRAERAAGTRAQSAADRRCRGGACGRPQGSEHLQLPQPRELREQLQAAGFHRRRPHHARQRQVHRSPGRLRHPRRHRQPPARASAGRRRPRRDPSAWWLGQTVADAERARRCARADPAAMTPRDAPPTGATRNMVAPNP